MSETLLLSIDFWAKVTDKADIALVAGQMANLTRTVAEIEARVRGFTSAPRISRSALTSNETEPKYNKNASTLRREN